MAGVGGDGGNHNKAEGGDIHFKASIESANLNDAFNDSKYFHIDDLSLSRSIRMRGGPAAQMPPVLNSSRSQRTMARKFLSFRSLAKPQC